MTKTKYFKNHFFKKKILLKILTPLLLIPILIFTTIDLYMYLSVAKHIAKPTTPKQYAIVLGASVHGDGLSGALRARMDEAINLYHNGLVERILMSGDGGSINNYYSETSAMKKYALKQNIPIDALYTDHMGYNTYMALYRAKKIFASNDAYIISQKFHIVRSVWIAREIGMDASGVIAKPLKSEAFYFFREYFACSKDFFLTRTKEILSLIDPNLNPNLNSSSASGTNSTSNSDSSSVSGSGSNPNSNSVIYPNVKELYK